jgi:hypothetical protein
MNDIQKTIDTFASSRIFQVQQFFLLNLRLFVNLFFQKMCMLSES